MRSSVHARSILTTARLSRSHMERMIPLEEVLSLLDAAGVEYVLAGAHAIGGYTKKPRATVDIDLLVAPRSHRKAVKALRAAYPDLILRDLEVVTRFVDPVTKEAAIDLMKPRAEILKSVFENSVRVKIAGRQTRIPNLEMAAATKFAAMVGVYRKRADKEQDGVDFRRIVEANPKLDVARLSRLCNLVYAGGGAEVRHLVEAIRRDEPLVF